MKIFLCKIERVFGKKNYFIPFLLLGCKIPPLFGVF